MSETVRKRLIELTHKLMTDFPLFPDLDGLYAALDALNQPEETP